MLRLERPKKKARLHGHARRPAPTGPGKDRKGADKRPGTLPRRRASPTTTGSTSRQPALTPVRVGVAGAALLAVVAIAWLLRGGPPPEPATVAAALQGGGEQAPAVGASPRGEPDAPSAAVPVAPDFETWRRSMRDTNPFEQLEGCMVASAVGADAVPDLVDALKSRVEATRFEAALALRAIGPAAVEPLLRALDDPRAAVRFGGVRGLRIVGDVAGAAAPRVEALLKDEDRDVRLDAALALGELGGAVGALEDAARREKDPLVAMAVDEALERLRGTRVDPPAASSFEQRFDQCGWSNRRGSSLAFVWRQSLALSRGDVPGEAAPLLVKTLAVGMNTTGLESRLLRRMWSADSAELSKLLKSNDHSLRMAAVECIGWHGPAAAPHVADLLPLLLDEGFNTEVRAKAAWALGRIGAPSAETRAALEAMKSQAQGESEIMRAGNDYLAAEWALRRHGR